MSAQDWWRTEPDVGKSGRTEPVAAPEAKIGSWWLTMHAPTPIRCKGYSMWPGTKPIGTYWRTIDAGTYIGPVTAVKVGPTYVTIFVRGWWINVWKRTQKKTGLGVFFCDSGARGRSASLERQWLVRRALMSCAHSFLVKWTKPKLPCERT